MKFAYYPGCSLHSSSIEYEISTREICKNLNIELQEIPDWICCGATSAHSIDKTLSLTLPAYNLALAEKLNLNLLCVCAACFNRFKNAKKELKEEYKTLFKIPFENKIEVKHLLEVLDLEEVTKNIKKSLNGLKVACYYGCLLLRPPSHMEFDNPEYPEKLENLIKILGGEAISWYHKNECCGASLSLTKREVSLQLSSKIIDMAKKYGAEIIATSCPLCQNNLDLRQDEMNKDFKMPVLYFTELIGIALGIEPEKLGINKHLVNPLPKLLEKGLCRG